MVRNFLKKLPVAVMAVMLLLGVLSVVLALPGHGAKAVASTSVGEFGANANPTGNPIGGGNGYVSPHDYVNATHDYTVTTLSELKSAISSATSGQIIWIPDGVTITISTIENAGARKVLSKTVPDGVVLASSRGYNGQAGGKIKVTAKATGYMTGIWFGSNCVVSGLTFEGPSAFSSSMQNCAIRCEAEHLEVENCEIYNFCQGGIYFEPPFAGYSIAWNSPKRHWVHHCYIHGIQQHGMGYGVAEASDFSGCSIACLVEACKLYDCRHQISCTHGRGYNFEIRYCDIGDAWYYYNGNTSSTKKYSCPIDAHGMGDSTSGYAGTHYEIHHNTFSSNPGKANIGVRGIPEDRFNIYNNWTKKTKHTGLYPSDGSYEIANVASSLVDMEGAEGGYVSYGNNMPAHNVYACNNWYGTTAPASGTTAAPVADFTAAPTSGGAPMYVQFTDKSLNTPTSWSWDFQNDGTTDSTSQNPTFTYTAAGSYTVKLTVQNSAGSDSETKTSYISAGPVSTSPTAAIQIGPGATNRSSSVTSAGYTDLEKNNPANADGTITSLELWFNTNATGVRVGTFFKTGTNTYQCRDSATLGSVTAGSTRTFTSDSSGNPLSIDVKTGDLIGWYISTGSIEADRSGGNGWYYYHGESIDPGDEVTFTPTTAMYCASIHASG
jgi:PKD repeat protein